VHPKEHHLEPNFGRPVGATRLVVLDRTRGQEFRDQITSVPQSELNPANRAGSPDGPE